jgi:hypothetical protein
MFCGYLQRINVTQIPPDYMENIIVYRVLIFCEYILFR